MAIPSVSKNLEEHSISEEKRYVKYLLAANASSWTYKGSLNMESSSSDYGILTSAERKECIARPVWLQETGGPELLRVLPVTSWR